MSDIDDKVNKSIERLKLGSDLSLAYYKKPLLITYSGGKDSEVLVDLAIKAKIPIEIVNAHTTADAPDTVRHIRKQLKRWEEQGIDCKIKYPIYKGERTSMWELIPQKKIPPTRKVRYCCSVLKENVGTGRMIATGVRWDESARRANSRSQFEISHKVKEKRILLGDNDDKRRLFETCTLKSQRTVNPIIDWTDKEIWEYAEAENLDMNPLYGCGFSRVGCVGCPLARQNVRYQEFNMFPTFKQMYINAFDRMLKNREQRETDIGGWQTGEDVFHWWMEDGVLAGQYSLFEEADK